MPSFNSFVHPTETQIRDIIHLYKGKGGGTTQRPRGKLKNEVLILDARLTTIHLAKT